MREDMKYIMINKQAPVLFSPALEHAAVANACVQSASDIITGAGFVMILPEGRAECYGSSVSLGDLPAGKHDSKIVTKTLFGEEHNG